MGSKSKRTDRRSKSVWLPSEDTLDSARNQLPFFEPYETGKLLVDAARANNGVLSDAAISEVYNQHCLAQTAQLLRALGYDPNDKQFWPKAFIKLARLHHNVGRLVHRQRLPSSAKAWTLEDESILLSGVYALVQTGLSERASEQSLTLRYSRITSDDLFNGHRAVRRELRVSELFGASMSDCGRNRR